MKKLIFAVMLCCSFIIISSAVAQQHNCRWDKNGHCFECRRTGDPEECRLCGEGLYIFSI